MNPVFVLLVILLGIAVWFSLNALFPKIGGFLCDLFDVVIDNFDIHEEDE